MMHGKKNIKLVNCTELAHF